jgi:hypothetical protein
LRSTRYAKPDGDPARVSWVVIVDIASGVHDTPRLGWREAIETGYRTGYRV